MQLGTGTFVVNAAAVDRIQGYTNECINYKIPPNNVVSGVLNVFQKNENKILNTFSVTDHSIERITLCSFSRSLFCQKPR